MNSLLADLRHGFRLLTRRPWLSAGLLLTMMLGIGANAGIFAVVSSVLLHPLPFREPSRLAVLWASDHKHADQQVEVSFRDLVEWQRRSKTFESFAAISSVNLDVTLTGEQRPQQIQSMLVSRRFFEVLGARTAMGTAPVPGATFTGAISYRLWQSRYGGDPHVIGRTIMADHAPVTITAVMPADFDFPHNVDFWYPLPDASLLPNQDIRVYRVLARLARRRSLPEARAEMETISQALERELPDQHRGLGVRIDALTDAIYGNARPALWILTAAAGLLLLTACVNAGNLLLSRAVSRRPEMALRAALGASHAQLLRQGFAEALPVALLSGAGGLLAARYGVAALVALAPRDIPRIAATAIDGGVVMFTLILTLLTVWLSALPGALHATSSAAAPEQTRVTRAPLRGGFIASQVAVSVVLIAGAFTLGRGFLELNRVNPGFRRDHVLTFRITLSKPEHAAQDARKRFYQNLLDRLRRIPGVQSAAAILLRPLSGTVGWDTSFAIEGQGTQEYAANPSANYEAISPEYFRTMRVPMIAGRDFDSGDRTGGEPVAIVSAALAHRYWPDLPASSKRIKLGAPASKAPWLRIVGVAADVRYREWDASRYDIYIPVQQRAQHRSDFVVRTAQSPLVLAAEIERAVSSVDPEQPVSSLTTLDSLVDDTFALPRLNLTLLGIFAACALLLAATGIFALLMHAITFRTREIGIRMALGAQQLDVVRLILSSALTWTSAGIGLGTAAALVASRALAAQLPGLKPAGAATLLMAGGLVLFASMAAAWIPALRAARCDPATTLRDE